MPLFLLTVGILAIIVAIKGNYPDVAVQIEHDFLGAGSFVYWAAAILLLAIIGNVTETPRAAKLFIALIIVVYVVSQPGLWAQGVAALGTAAPAPASTSEVGTGATAAQNFATTSAATIGATVSSLFSGALNPVAPGVAAGAAGIAASVGPGGASVGTSIAGIPVSVSLSPQGF